MLEKGTPLFTRPTERAVPPDPKAVMAEVRAAVKAAG